MTTTLDDDAVSELDNVIDGALALPVMAETWRVAGSRQDKRMALLFQYFLEVDEQEEDPEFLLAVAARTVDRLHSSFENCTCADEDTDDVAEPK